MDTEELKEALVSRRPVMASLPSLSKGEFEYLYVSAIIYRRNKQGGIDVSAEIMDTSLNSVTIIDPKHISYKKF